MLNKWAGIGRWSKDIELRYTNSGDAVASSTVAVNEKIGSRESVLFMPVVMWKKLGESVSQYSGKGRLVYVEGRISQREYEKDGNKVRVMEVVADTVRFLDRSENGGNSGTRQSNQPDPFEDDPFA